MIETFQIEDSAEQCPDEWKISHDDGRAAFTNVPIRPLTAEGVGETVVFVQDGGEDDEHAETEYPKDESFSIPR